MKKNWKTIHNSSGKSELLQSKPKRFKKDYEFSKKLHLWKTSFIGHVTWAFDKPAETWKPKFEYFNLKVRIDEEKFKFFQKFVIMVNFFLRIEKIQFRHSCQQFKAKSLFSCAQRPKKLKKKIIFPGKQVFPHRFPGHKKKVLTTLFQSTC